MIKRHDARVSMMLLEETNISNEGKSFCGVKAPFQAV